MDSRNDPSAFFNRWMLTREISNPLMWKFTVVAEAKPVIVLVASSTCLTSQVIESFAATVTSFAIVTLFNSRSNVASAAAVSSLP